MQLNHEIIYQLVLSGTLLFFVFTIVFVCTVILFRKRRNEDYLMQQKQVLEIKNKFLKVAVEERELAMKEISRDIQGEILSLIMYMRMNLHEVEALSSGEEQAKYTKTIIDVAEKLIKQIQDYGHSLDSGYIKEKGLSRMLEDDAEIIRAGGQIDCFVDIKGDESLLELEQQMVVYRIAQECMRNTLKHAQAYLIEVDLKFDEREFRMKVSDDGTGFNLDVGKEKGLMGIKGMEQRAELLGGKLEIKSGSLIGTQISLTIPKDYMVEVVY